MTNLSKPGRIWAPNPGVQTAFMASPIRELLYGGAAGGGKSEGILYLPGYRIHHPLHRSVILRRTRPELQELIDRSLVTYPQIFPGARWKESESRWIWPSGAITRMGYAEHEKDIQNFKTFEFDLVAFDELTSFTQYMYTYMFSRNRTKSKDLPPIMRSASNPDGEGSMWVFERFVDKKLPFQVYDYDETIVDPKGNELTVHLQRQFIPATVWDNPMLPEKDKYIAGIMQMGAETAAQLLYGQWGMTAGSMFKVMPMEVPPKLMRNDYYVVRAMDYGWGDYTCVYHAVVYPDNTIDIISEIYVRETTLDDIIALIVKREEELGLRKAIFSVGSPDMFKREATSNKTIGSIMTNKGVWIMPAKDDRIAGWAQTINFLSRNQIRVWAGRAPNLLRTLPHMKKDPLKPNELKKYQEDHAADTLRYLVMAIHEQIINPKATNAPNEEYRDDVFEKVIADLQSRENSAIFPGLGAW